MSIRPKCVFVIGPESTGSKLIAKICSHVLDIQPFGRWDGTAWSDKGQHCVLHRSLPYYIPPVFPDVQAWIEEKQANYDLYFVLTTRDITMSHLSRYERWQKPESDCIQQSKRAREIMLSIMNSEQKSFIWSYETFMFLRQSYLHQLYEFLGVTSDFIPDLIDANAKKFNAYRKTGIEVE